MITLLRMALVMAALALALLPARAGDPILIFAAASLKTALDEAAALYEARAGTPVRISYAGSLSLARQIEQGAPADIFASADAGSMDYAQKAGALRDDSRFNFLGNRLVVVTARPSRFNTLEFAPEAWRAALGQGRIATGEVNSVPVGKYAKSAMVKLGLWEEFGTRLAMSDNVRAALAFVARNELPLGIVYASDAKAEPAVKVVAVFPELAHAPIVYPFALTRMSGNPEAAAFLAFLHSASVRAIFEDAGFAVLQ